MNFAGVSCEYNIRETPQISLLLEYIGQVDSRVHIGLGTQIVVLLILMMLLMNEIINYGMRL